jgi:hypothetical protein
MAVNESKDRLWPMWLWIIMLAVVAACGLLTIMYDRQARQKETARVIAQHELLSHHWTSLESDTEFRSVIYGLAGRANADITSHIASKTDGVVGTISIQFGPAANRPDASIALNTSIK